jgi:hypothetical protein
VGVRPNPRTRALRSVFKTYIDIVHIGKAEADKMASEDPSVGVLPPLHDAAGGVVGAGAAAGMGADGDMGGAAEGEGGSAAAGGSNAMALDGADGSALAQGGGASADAAAAAGASEFLVWNRDVYAGGSVAAMLARRDRCLSMCRDGLLYPHLAASLAPSIWQMEDVKKGACAQRS